MISTKIATKFLTSNKVQMWLIFWGIGIGVAVQIFIGSLIFGLQDSLIDKTVGSSPHITIRNKESSEYILGDSDRLLEVDGVKAVSHTLDLNVFKNNNDVNTPILLRGVTFSEANKIYKFKENVVKGTYPTKRNEVVVGKGLLEELNLKIGDTLELDNLNMKLKIVGAFDLKVESVNTLWMIGDINYIQEKLSLENKLTSIELQIDDPFMSDQIVDNLKVKDTEEIVNWKQQNEQLLSGLSGQSISSYMIQFFVIISVVLGISSVLIISVVQKQKEIGILKAMGLTDKTTSNIFILQGLFYGIIGGILGVCLGIGLLYMFTSFVLNADGTPVVPITLSYKFIIFSFLVALVASIVSSIIPSLKSSKLNPVEVIKNG